MTSGRRCREVQCKLWMFCILGTVMLQGFVAGAHQTDVGQGAHRPHVCVHDTHVVPQVSKWTGQARLDPGPASRRQLSTISPDPAPIRITPVFQIDDLDVPRRSFLSTVLVPAATRYLQRLYLVRYPVSGPLLLQRSCRQVLTGQWSNGTAMTACSQWASLTCLESALDPDHFDAYTICDARSVCASTPAGAGLADTDFVLYVTAKNTSVCQTGTIAYASFCTQDGATDRPTSGSANFCPDQIDPVHKWAFQLDTAVHELTHAFGFSAALFKYYRDANNVPLVPRNTDGSIPQQADLSAVVRTFAERGTTATKLVTPKVTQAARDQFGCETLNGAELENDGGPGTAGSHWEERIFLGELMTAVTQPQAVYSRLTAAALEDSGWYVPTYDVTQPLQWGQGRGCAFPLASCAPGGPVPMDTAFTGFYCGTGFRSWTDDAGGTTSLDHMCTPDNNAVGYCQACNTTDSICFTDGCSPIVAVSNYVCTDASLVSDSDATNSSSPAFWGQARGAGAKCVADGSEMWSKDGFERPPVGGGCYQYECSWDVTGAQATLTVFVGGHPVTCIDGQEVPLSAAGFDSGSLGPCPVANAFCAEGGCVNDCSNKGICVSETCKCLIGWAGTDCSQLQCTDGVCPSGYVCDALSGVCLTATLTTSPSPSPSPANNLQPGPSFSPVPSPSRSPSPSASPSASALPASASPSPSVRPSPLPRPISAPATVSGIAFDGYFANCTLCMDANNNRRCDSFEATSVTNATGGFHFQQVTVYDYGPVLLRLGDPSCVDSLTNLLPTTIMVAPMVSSVVSPLTTFVQALMDVGSLSVSEAESTARAALGLPSTAQILAGDPIQGLLMGESGSLAVLKSVAYLNNVAAQFGALLVELSESRSPSVDMALSLSVYRAMATLALGAQASPSPAKGSHVPASATVTTTMTSLADGSNCSGGSYGLLEDGHGCSMDAQKLSPGELRVPTFKKPERRNLVADVDTTPSLNLTDVSTLQEVLDLSVADAKSSGAIVAGSDISADVAASVVSLAANSNALVAAVAPGDGLQTLSQIGVAARGSVLESIQEMGAGNITVATFAANSAPDRLALIAAHTNVSSALTAAAAAAFPPASPPPQAITAAPAAATIVQAAGNGVYLIAGLLVGLFVVLGAAIGFIFWQWRRMQREWEEKLDARNGVLDGRFRGGLKGWRRRRSKRRSRRVSDGGDSEEKETGDESVQSGKEDGNRSAEEESALDENGAVTESVTQSETEPEEYSRRYGRGGTRQQHRNMDGSDGSEGSEGQSDGQEELMWVHKGPRKQRTRGRPRLDQSHRRSAGESESEDIDRALVLNRGESTAVELANPGRKPPGFRNSHGDRGAEARQNGSYIYAHQQIIIINQGNGSESDSRAEKPRTSRYGPPRHVPVISATSTATLALEAGPNDADVAPYVTAPSDDEAPGDRLVVTEMSDGSASEDGRTAETERTDSREPTTWTAQQSTGKAEGSDGGECSDVPLRSGAVLPVAAGRNQHTFRPVNESFHPAEDGLIVSSTVSTNPSPVRMTPLTEPLPSSRTNLPVKESFVVAESSSGNPVLISKSAPATSLGVARKRDPAPSERPNSDGHVAAGAPPNDGPPRAIAGAQIAGPPRPKPTSPVRRPVPKTETSTGTAPASKQIGRDTPKGLSTPTGAGESKPIFNSSKPESIPGARPESAPVRPAKERNLEGAPSARPQSALSEGDKLDAVVRQASPQKKVPKAPPKPAWEGKQARSENDRGLETVVAINGGSARDDGVVPRQQSPVRTKSGGPVMSRKTAPLDKQAVKRGPETSVARSSPQAGTASFTFDFEEQSTGQLSRSPSALPGGSLSGANNPPSSSFATVSLALMKKAAPTDVKQPPKGRQLAAAAKRGTEEKPEPSMAPIRIVSASLSRSPTKTRESIPLKEPSSPQRKRAAGGEAGSAAGSDQAARPVSPRKVPGGPTPVKRVVGTEKAATTTGVVVDLRKGARQ